MYCANINNILCLSLTKVFMNDYVKINEKKQQERLTTKWAQKECVYL